MIAMALICRPALLIADEPSTALDVTIQAQILKLIQDLRKELGMALLLITHDLGVVANVAEEVVVMYRGRVVESGTLEDLFGDPRHPYLKALLGAVPHFDMKRGERLKPLREIRSGTGHLLARRDTQQANTRVIDDAPLLRGQRARQELRLRKRDGLFGSGDGAALEGHRRRQLPYRAGHLLRPRRRKRLRQDDGQQDHPARDPARCRPRRLQRWQRLD